MKRKKKLNLFITILELICIVIFIYSGINIINWKKDANENDKIQEKIEENINIVEPQNEEEKSEYNIDFETLKEQNLDTIAYVKVNNTNIDYIVVKGKDNSYYLNHNFNKKSNVLGWIFADYHNKFDETDKNIILYGHNATNGSMFGSLKKVLDKDWHENEENLEIDLVTEQGQYKYRVFSTYSTKPEEYYINTEFKDDDEFNSFINTLKSKSNYDYGIEVSSLDKILTLSSCYGNSSKRVVLHAKLIKKIPIEKNN